MTFRFADPWWLMGIVLVLGATFWNRRQARPAMLFSSNILWQHLPISWAQRAKEKLPWLRAIALSLVCVALARPQQGKEEYLVRTDGVAIQMCLDRSGSMQALDFEIDGKRTNRLEAVKEVFREFVVGGTSGLPGRKNDPIGLIVFGGFVDCLSPLTLDHQALTTALETVEIPDPPRQSARGQSPLDEELATAIGDAVALAVDRLQKVPAKSKIIVLLSDGESNAGVLTPEEAAQLAQTAGIKIYTIGIGSNGPVPMPTQDLFGRTVLTHQYMPLDERTLRMLAERTGGQYFNAQDTDALRRVYAEIDRLEKTEMEERHFTHYRDLYPAILWCALGLLVGEAGLVTTRFLGVP